MKIIICGAGEVGFSLDKYLSSGLLPLIVNEPSVRGISPAIALNSVDFPPPLGPTTATFFPLSIEKFTLSKAGAFPKCTQHPSEIIRGVLALFTSLVSIVIPFLLKVSKVVYN